MKRLASVHVVLIHVLLLFSDNFCLSGPTQKLQKDGVEFAPYDRCEANPRYMSAPSAPLANCKNWYKDALYKRHPDQHKSTGQIIQTYNYPYKVHKIHTEDRYILTAHRITGSPKRSKKQNAQQKPAVIIMHGLTLASDGRFFLPANRILPFKLADAGYEVWIPSARGTTYSLGHEKLNHAKDLKYWDFSWHEMGVYDIPALTEKVLEESGNKKLFYVGHSQGATKFFVALSERPELNKKYHAAVLMAPQAYSGHMNCGSRNLMPLIDTHPKFQFFNILTKGRFPHAKEMRQKLGLSAGEICEPAAARCGLCDNLVFSIFGANPHQINNSHLPFVFAKTPNSFPLKAMAHYAQATTTCTFRKYDYGSAQNLIKYKQTEPPDYQLKNIKAPIYFFYALMDTFVPANDVNVTAHKMSPGVLKENYQVPDERFTHADFAIAKDADKLVYNKVLDIFNGYR